MGANPDGRVWLDCLPVKRHLTLPASGWLLVSTDLHGNWRDFAALSAFLGKAWQDGLDAHWVILGDLVHGPNAEAGLAYPHLYAYPDDSPRLIDAVFELRAARADRVHFVLGNHDAGHCGFKHTSKFHPDEVLALERRLTSKQKDRLRELCERALLTVATRSGLLLAHGAPGDELHSLALLDGTFPVGPEDDARFRAVHEVMWSYGQKGDVAGRMLERIGAELGQALRVVVHGHDRDESGWFIEGGNQLQPVIFGAPDANKRFLWLDLARPIGSAQELVDCSLRHLHG